MRMIWSTICRFLSNARGMVLLLAILLLTPLAQPFSEWLDNHWFSWASYLQKQSDESSNVVMIELPYDVSGSQSKRFLERVAAESPKGIAFIGLPFDSKLRKGLRQLSIPAGVVPGSFDSDAVVFSTAKRIAPVDPSYKAPIFTSLLRHPPTLGSDSKLRKNTLYVPLGKLSQQQHNLVWLQGRLPIADLMLRVYSDANKNQKIYWKEGVGLSIDRERLLTGPDGRIYIPSAVRPDIPYFSSTEFGRGESLRQFHNKTIIISQGSLAQMESLARVMSAMLNEQSVHVPAWAYLVFAMVVILIVFYLFVLLPTIRFTTGILISGMMIAAIMAGQIGLLLTTQLWLPLTILMAFIILGHSLMSLALCYEKKLNHLIQEKDDALLLLGKKEVEAAEYDEAAETLLRCKPRKDVFELIYTIGIEFERQRRYDKAFRLFSRLSRMKKGYRDIGKRLKTLADVQSQTSPAKGGFNGASTLVMPEMGLEHPVLGRYELRREIGRGAMGIVYLGHDPKIVRDVAVKTINLKQFSGQEADAIKTRFFREAEAAGRLNHPNIVTVFDIGDEQSLAFIAMDYVPGKPLSEYTDVGATLDCDTVYRLIGQAAQAIDYAHRQGIVHRDIKPGNLLYNENEDRIKVSDFGIARVTDTTTTRTGTVLGSPSYMAPEQLTDGKVDGRADIFSLGVTLYQLLTSELPFKGDSLPSLAYQITNKKHRSIRELRPELPARIVRIINKALQKNPDKRYATAQEMADALAKA